MTDKRIVAHDMDGVPLTCEELSIINKLLDKMDNNKTDNSAHGYSEGSEVGITNPLFQDNPESLNKYIEIVSLKKQLKQKDEETQQLKEALKEIERITLLEFYTEYELLQSIKNKLIELNKPEK